MIKEITVQELKQKLDKEENIILIDVREKDEFDFCCIKESIHMPLSEFIERAESEFGLEDEIYIHCHHGGRSMRACEHLLGLGYESIFNVKGGIDAWSLHVDPKVKRY